MKYLCLIYEDQSKGANLPKEVIEQAMAQYHAYTSDLKQSGHCVEYGAFPPGTVTTLRVRNGKTSTTDGPYAETKEQLGVYYLLEAKDLNDAIRLAEKIPSAQWGSVEVRPVMEF